MPRANGVDITTDEIKAFLEEKRKEDTDLSPEELENAAGGKCSDEAFTSVYIGGLACPE